MLVWHYSEKSVDLTNVLLLPFLWSLFSIFKKIVQWNFVNLMWMFMYDPWSFGCDILVRSSLKWLLLYSSPVLFWYLWPKWVFSELKILDNLFPLQGTTHNLKQFQDFVCDLSIFYAVSMNFFCGQMTLV